MSVRATAPVLSAIVIGLLVTGGILLLASIVIVLVALYAGRHDNTQKEEVSRGALIVYESMFGNTAKVAHAVADGLGVHMAVELVGGRPRRRSPTRSTSWSSADPRTRSR